MGEWGGFIPAIICENEQGHFKLNLINIFRTYTVPCSLSRPQTLI